MTPREEAVRHVARWWTAQLTRPRGPGDVSIIVWDAPDHAERLTRILFDTGMVRTVEWDDVTPARGAFGRRRAAEAVQRAWILTWPGPELIAAVVGAGIVPNIALYPLGIETMLTEDAQGVVAVVTRAWAGAQPDQRNFGP